MLACHAPQELYLAATTGSAQPPDLSVLLPNAATLRSLVLDVPALPVATSEVWAHLLCAPAMHPLHRIWNLWEAVLKPSCHVKRSVPGTNMPWIIAASVSHGWCLTAKVQRVHLWVAEGAREL